MYGSWQGWLVVGSLVIFLLYLVWRYRPALGGPEGRLLPARMRRSGPVDAKIRAAVARYPYKRSGDYAVWPGPNSNSFVAYLLAAIPETGITLPPTAVGKDWRVDGRVFGLTPSGTGIQLSFAGLLGFTIAWVEGVEVNVLGIVTGIDIRRPAIKLPGFGRIGVGTVA